MVLLKEIIEFSNWHNAELTKTGHNFRKYNVLKIEVKKLDGRFYKEIYIEHDNVTNKSVIKPVKIDIFQEKYY